MSGASHVQVRRVYDPPDERDSHRVLVDRLWPRGLSKARAHLDDWRKDVAPSPELRRWYSHEPRRYDEFARRYRRELRDPTRAAAYEGLLQRADQGDLTLLTATKRIDISAAATLAGLLAASWRPSRRGQG